MVFNSRDIRYKTPFGAISTDREFTVRFPVPQNADVKQAYIMIGKQEYAYYQLSAAEAEDGYCFYTATLSFSQEGIYWYRFKFITGEGELNYGADEFKNAQQNSISDWQLTVYRKDYRTPEFIKGGLIYHIFADRFNKSGVNKTKRKYRIHSDWYERPEIISPDGNYYADDFFGGNLNGIMEKLDYIKALGADVIYLSPIFEAMSNHRYDTGDYFKIDPLLGDEEQFKRLVSEAARRGISIILDGVFNHTGADSVYFNKFGTYEGDGAYQSKHSPYYGWYTFQSYPHNYTSWWGCTNVPTVVHNHPQYRKMILGEGGVIEKWTGAGVKGWRLDVVDELPVDFVTDLRTAIKTANPEAAVIGEVWENASVKASYGIQRPYLDGYQLDGVMNYPFKNAIIDFVMRGDINLFKGAIWDITESYPEAALACSMNIIGTHDTVRAVNALSGADMRGTTKEERRLKKLSPQEYALGKERLKLAALLQYTLPGIPTLYYGDEAGVEGYEDPLNRSTYPWGREDGELLEHYRLIGKIRRENRDVFSGGFKIEDEYRLLVYRRTAGGKSIYAAVNPTDGYVKYDFSARAINLIKGNVTEDGEYWFAPREYGLFEVNK